MNPLRTLLSVTTLLFVHSTAHQGDFRCNTPEPTFQGQRKNGSIDSFYRGTKWPNGVVTYQLHSSLTQNDRAEVQKAFDDIQSKTCIRFQARTTERAYTSIEVDDSVCGWGHFCRTGRAQAAKFGQGCRFWSMMVHELGHNLCLTHEHQRRDRDDYLKFDGCSADQIPEKQSGSNFDSRGTLYDYLSQMHYPCNSCSGGYPKTTSRIRCGNQITKGLSVLDADKLNDFYDCKECRQHRWSSVDALTDTDRKNLVKFGETESRAPIYLCRAHIDGEIAIGKYYSDKGQCYVPYYGHEHGFRRAQVFTLTNGDLNQRQYRYGTDENAGKPVPCGSQNNGVIAYCAIADSLERNGVRERNVPGKVFASDMNKAYFGINGVEVSRNAGEFKILRCNN